MPASLKRYRDLYGTIFFLVLPFLLLILVNRKKPLPADTPLKKRIISNAVLFVMLFIGTSVIYELLGQLPDSLLRTFGGG